MRTTRKSYKYDSSDYDNGDYDEDDFDGEEDDNDVDDQQNDSHQDSDYDDSQNVGGEKRKQGVNVKQSKSNKRIKKEDFDEEFEDSYEDEDPFSPEIDQILADRQVEIQISSLGAPTQSTSQVQVSNQQNPNSNKSTRIQQPQTKKVSMFLVKYTDQSYLHVKWVEESQLEEYSYRAKQKIRRYFNAKEKKRIIQEHLQRQAIAIKPKQKHHFSDDEEEEEEDEDAAIKGISLPDLPIIIEDTPVPEITKPLNIPVISPEGDDLTQFFDKNYTAIERVLSTTLLFPIIHPRQAKQIKGKWQDDCLKVVNVLANFRKNNVAIGLAFQFIKNPKNFGPIQGFFSETAEYITKAKKEDSERVALPPVPPETYKQHYAITKQETSNSIPVKTEREAGNIIVNLSSLLSKNQPNQDSKQPNVSEASQQNQNLNTFETNQQSVAPTGQQIQQLQNIDQFGISSAASAQQMTQLQQIIPPEQMTPNTMFMQQQQNQAQNQQQLIQQLQQQQLAPSSQSFKQQQQNFGLQQQQQQQMQPPSQLPHHFQDQLLMQQTPSLPSINQLMNPIGGQISQLNPMSQIGMGNGGAMQGYGGNQYLDPSQLNQSALLPGMISLNQQQFLNPLQQQQMRHPQMINPQQQTQEFLQSQLQAQIDQTGQISLPSIGQIQQNMYLNQVMNQINPFQQQIGQIDPQIHALQQQQDKNLNFFNQMMGIPQQQLNQYGQLEMMQLMAQQQFQQDQIAMQMRSGMSNPGQLPSINNSSGFGQQSSQFGNGMQLPSLSQVGQYNQQLSLNGQFDQFQQNLLGLQNPQSNMMNQLMQQPGNQGLMRFPSTMHSSNAYDEMSMMLNNIQQQNTPTLPGLQQGFNPFGGSLTQNNMLGYSQQLPNQLPSLHSQNLGQFNMRNSNNIHQNQHMQQQPQFTRINEVNLIEPDNQDQYNEKQTDPLVPPCIMNPGEYDLSWLLDAGETPQNLTSCSFITQEEIDYAVKNKSFVDQLYLIKWKSLSYSQATWEPESVIMPIFEEKMSDYKMFNRALDQNQREKLDSLIKNHKKMLRFTEKKYQGKKMDEHQQNMIALQEAKINRQLLNQKIQEIMGQAFYQIVQYSYKDDQVPQFKKPNQKLKDYQVIGLNWLIRAWHSHRNVVLADEMGLGKTIMTLSLFEHFNRVYRLKGPYLILAPLTTLEHWKRIAEEWTTLNSVLYYDPGSAEGRSEMRFWEWFYTDITYKGQTTQKSELYKFNIIITSFEVFMQDLSPIIQEIPFLYIVVDEAHRLKNKQAKTLKLLKDHPCKRILLLTGTPVQNNTKELWTLLNYIEPEKFNSLDDFLENYGNLESFDQIQKLHSMLKPHFLRRLKEEVDNSIPPLQETVIEVGLTTVQSTYYKGIYGENRMMLAKFGTNSIKTSQLNNIDVQLRKCCNHLFLLKGVEEELTKDCKNEEDLYKKLLESSGKLMLLDKFIEKFKKENHKMLIFSQFKRMLDIIELYLKMKAVPFEKLTGSVKTQDRISAIQRFNDDKTFGVFLLTTRAGGLGINLTSARVVIIFDSDWNPQNDLQAIARAHRIGQKFEVQVFRLITSKTYEEQMFERASKKLGMEQALFSKGAFNQNDDNEFSQLHLRGFTELKQDSKEIENLLKYGAYAFMEDAKGEDEQNYNKDIDEILATGKKKEFVYNKGIYTLQKSTFNAVKYENLPDFDDPEFWNKVMPLNSVMSIGMLEKRFKKEKKEMAKSEKMQKEFFKDLEVVFNDFIDAKFDTKTSASSKKQFESDEEKLREILNKMVKLNGMKLIYVEKCKEWMREMLRTNKRKKPLQTMFQDNDAEGANPREVIAAVEKNIEEEEDIEMHIEEDDIIIYDSDDDKIDQNRRLRQRNPVVQQTQQKYDFDEPVLLKKRGRKPKNAYLNMQQSQTKGKDAEESEGMGDEEEDNYGDEEDKDYNEKFGKKGYGKDDDYGDSDEQGYGLRNQRKRQKTGKDQDFFIQNQHSQNASNKHLPKINEQIIKRNEKNGIVCGHCFQPATSDKICTYFCQGYCQRFFHEDCKDQMFDSNDDTKRRLRNQLQHNSHFWQCDDCLENKATCFVCKIKGQILLFPKKGKPKAAGQPDGLLISSNNANEDEEAQDDEDNMIEHNEEPIKEQEEPNIEITKEEQKPIDQQIINKVQDNEEDKNDANLQEEVYQEAQDALPQQNQVVDQVEEQEIQNDEELSDREKDQSQKQVKSQENQDQDIDLEEDIERSMKHQENGEDAMEDVKQDEIPSSLKQGQDFLKENEFQNNTLQTPQKNIELLEEAKTAIKIQASPETELNDKKFVVRCTLGGCFKYYHVDCVYQNKNVSCINSMKVQRFRCPLHYCEICQASGDSVLIVQCLNCPTAYHLKCLPSDLKAIRLTKKYIICGKHEMSPENFPKYEEKSNGYVSVKSLTTQPVGNASNMNAEKMSDPLLRKKKPKKRGRKPKNPILQEQEDDSEQDEPIQNAAVQINHQSNKGQNAQEDIEQDQEMVQSISQQQLNQNYRTQQSQPILNQSSSLNVKLESQKNSASVIVSNQSQQRSLHTEERLINSTSSGLIQRQNSFSSELRSEIGNQGSRNQPLKPLFAVEKSQSRNTNLQ